MSSQNAFRAKHGDPTPARSRCVRRACRRAATALLTWLVLLPLAPAIDLLPAHPATAAAGSPLVSFTATSRLTYPAVGSRPAGAAQILLVINRPVQGQAQVVSWDGSIVREILHPSLRPAGTTRLRWDGAGPGGLPAADGPYRVRLALTDPSGSVTRAEIQVARVSAPAYPVAPSSIVVFLDPGHGGPETGPTATLPDGTGVRESDVDLDVALRLAAMLRDAGVRVSMSRTSDTQANRAGIDRTGDGRVDDTDDLQARMDAANNVRADLYVAIHNNWIPLGQGRTEAFYCGRGCTGSDASHAAAAAVLGAHAARLASLVTPDWEPTLGDPKIPEAERNPTDDYLRFASASPAAGRHFYVLGPYDAGLRPRPIQMPGLLAESLSLSNPHELQLLATPEVRTLLASAYYDGIAAYFAQRPSGLRLDPAAPAPAARVGLATSLRVSITNNSSVTLPAGVRLMVGAAPLSGPYDGSPSPGTPIGTAVLSKALPPGRAATVAVPVRPGSAGAQLWKVDAVVGGTRASTLRVPFLQVRVSVAP